MIAVACVLALEVDQVGGCRIEPLGEHAGDEQGDLRVGPQERLGIVERIDGRRRKRPDGRRVRQVEQDRHLAEERARLADDGHLGLAAHHLDRSLGKHIEPARAHSLRDEDRSRRNLLPLPGSERSRTDCMGTLSLARPAKADSNLFSGNTSRDKAVAGGRVRDSRNGAIAAKQFAMDSDMSQTSASAGTVAFIDLAGFSAIADVYGDESAIAMLEIFEGMVREALSAYEPPIKWIGDEAMLSFPEPEIAIQALGTLLQACRKEPRLPLTRTALNHGPVVRRAGDLFGSTVNIASRITALAAPGQLLATQPIADAARARGI